ncbi:MAG: nucleotidyl transferase AbiEii/AbiGii toxin family protein [Bacteroidota bacterium]
MRNIDYNLKTIVTIASALNGLEKEVVYVGGAVVNLYSNTTSVEDIRPTKDIDIGLNITTVGELETLRQELNNRGFYQSIEDNVICRFRYEKILVDILSTEEVGWAPANRWFKPGFDFLNEVKIEKTKILILSLPFFLASKFEAFNNRGIDPRTSHDFEDIVYIFNNRKCLSEDLVSSPKIVREYLGEQIRKILSNSLHQEAIFGHLPYSLQEQKYELILEELRIFLNSN